MHGAPSISMLQLYLSPRHLVRFIELSTCFAHLKFISGL